jgi:hypothetical protein
MEEVKNIDASMPCGLSIGLHLRMLLEERRGGRSYFPQSESPSVENINSLNRLNIVQALNSRDAQNLKHDKPNVPSRRYPVAV